MPGSPLDNVSDAYEVAEASFLRAVRGREPLPTLAVMARHVAKAAESFNAEAYRRLHAGEEEGAWMSLDQLTERTEVLSELWQDVATAYEDSLSEQAE